MGKRKRYPQDYTNEELSELHFGKCVGSIRIIYDCGEKDAETFVSIVYFRTKDDFAEKAHEAADSLVRSVVGTDATKRAIEIAEAVRESGGVPYYKVVSNG